MEFPINPTERQKRKQQEIAEVIGAISTPTQTTIDFVQEPRLPLEAGWDRYLSYYLGERD